MPSLGAKTFITLTKKPSPITTVSEEDSILSVPVGGPTLFIPGVVLPVEDDDLNTTMMAEVKLRPTRVSSSTVHGKPHRDYEFLVEGIRFA
jgi:hypothetical protein